ncbi:N-acetylglutaminylglutamine synthetase [uncultured Sneathiella sp.]|uniref:N-acetylglutaminylglutamine synthetase n=1 Tax=uncultured Sneathiella sp. TaxID=879315 RepID=UPI0025923439|nr:N-acetylglutaminylglutamine synthetase [uncultured Sneathiella sp.]
MMTSVKQNSQTDTLRASQVSLKNWGDPPESAREGAVGRNVAIDCGWGRLIFGQTFDDAKFLAKTLSQEVESQRDVAIYVHEPHVVLSYAPQSLFLDPSHTFRLDLTRQPERAMKSKHFTIRAAEKGDEKGINRLYLGRDMVPVSKGYIDQQKLHSAVEVLVALENEGAGEIIGVVMSVDHQQALQDPDNGSSLWALAVDPQAPFPGIGEALVEALADRRAKAGRSFMDLSVVHDNHEAIALYQKLGFEQIPVYTIKHKNPINEKLFIGPAEDARLNVYAKIIVDEARRRGIQVEIEDTEAGLFRLSHGGRSIACRESLSDLTSAVALSRCDDKRLTHRLLEKAGLRQPEQIIVTKDQDVTEFCTGHKRVVVKPASGEQGRGVSVGLNSVEEVTAAIKRARELCDSVILEEYVTGQDLRIIVINEEVVAAAIRRPPIIKGDGETSIKALVEKLSRRREAATIGESSIPMDDETFRCVRAAGHEMSDVLPKDESITVRRTANLHTGGTIHDVTDILHREMRTAAITAAQTLGIPVVGLDFIVEDPAKPGYAVIEANERPGLANHQPQPTVEKFIDLLFPQTKADSNRSTT